MSHMEYLVAEELYNTYGKKPEQPVVLKQGTPLVTKDSNRYSNAVVYKVFDNGVHQRYQIMTDFGNRMMFPSAEDVLFYWDISEAYKEYCQVSEELDIEDRVLDTVFCLRERLDRQLELITNAIKELE